MTDSRLYILMRTDMASMNPGKGMAQAAHAANAFVRDWGESSEYVLDWQKQTPQGFGTTITLAVTNEDAMRDMIDIARALDYPAGIIHDPSYPVRDGEITHLIPINTCGYIFVEDASKPPPGLSILPLHP